MFEIAVILTNIFNTIICGLLSARLWRQPNVHQNKSKLLFWQYRLAAAFIGCAAVSSLIGAFAHSQVFLRLMNLNPYDSNFSTASWPTDFTLQHMQFLSIFMTASLKAFFWHSTLYIFGLISFFVYLITISLYFPSFFQRFKTIIIAISSLIYIGFIIVLHIFGKDFLFGILYYVPGAFFLMITAAWCYRRDKSQHHLYFIVAIILILSSSAMQQFKIGLHPVYFNHNALYHILGTLFMFLMYKGVMIRLRKQ